MTKYIVVRTAESVRPFECSSCGYTANARVLTKTAGSAQYSKEDAAHSAERAVEADSSSSLGLVRCPRCGRRNRRTLISLALWTLIPAVFFACIAVWFWPLGGFKRFLAVVWAAAAIGVVLVGKLSLSRAEREVRFID